MRSETQAKLANGLWGKRGVLSTQTLKPSDPVATQFWVRVIELFAVGNIVGAAVLGGTAAVDSLRDQPSEPVNQRTMAALIAAVGTGGSLLAIGQRKKLAKALSEVPEMNE